MRFRRFSCPALLAVLCAACALPIAAQESRVWCDALGRRLRSVNAASCRKLPFAPGQIRSVEGRPLMLRDVPPVKTNTNTAPMKIRAGASGQRAARIFLIGGIHGDELTSVSIVFRWMEWLAEANARRYHWRIAPLANPDGLLAQPARRTNGHGVDLNRNFSTPDWSRDALAYWQKRTGKDPRRYPGKAATSEPETQWLETEIANFKPDVIVSIHAPYGVLDYDGPLQKPRRFGRLNLNQLGVYPGSLGNFGGVYKNIPVITIELPHATAMPTPTEQRQIWDDMLAWINKNIAP
ncbi:MAG: succinylglutamate desuccinylase/aspartoacylase family protein [Zoogloeaceae bacterium]|jgi:hypothetical protein|nr:succinylglutamate desuccinylase/aspartoacylase family protein [Zoogloeaceae bacterium]